MNPVTNFEKWINSIATGTAPDIPPVTRFEHFLNKIRLAIARKSDITSGLPDVTAEDNDKVLTVVDGVWDKAAPSGGGGGVLVVHRALNESNRYVLDKTWKEMKDASFVILSIEETGKGGGTHWVTAPVTDFDYEYFADAVVYEVVFSGGGAYETDNESGYPVSPA